MSPTLSRDLVLETISKLLDELDEHSKAKRFIASYKAEKQAEILIHLMEQVDGESNTAEFSLRHRLVRLMGKRHLYRGTTT